MTDVTIFARIDARNLPVIAGIRFGAQATLRGARAVPGDDPRLAALAGRIRALLDGKNVAFDNVRLDIARLSGFSRRVLGAAQSIGWGDVISYSRLAARAGSPGAVRAAASVMRRNDFPLVIPCHRVVRADGTVGGFMGAVRGKKVRLKARLLSNEGETGISDLRPR